MITRRMTWLMLMLVSCSGPMKLQSDWTDEPVQVDGRQEEWATGLNFVESEKILFGIRNDRDYLYLCIIPQERMTGIQMMMQGFTVWLDSTGGKSRILGIKFPLGTDGVLPVPMGGPMVRKQQDGGDFDRQMQERLREYEVLGPAPNDRRRFSVGEDSTLSVQLKMSERGPVYELKVPLRAGRGQIYGIGTQPGRWVGIGLEVTEIRREPPRNGGKPMGGGRPTGGGMGGPGGGMRMMNPEMFEPMKWWTRVLMSDRP